MYWSASGSTPSFWLSRPTRPEELDTVVVGGGFVGLSAAYWLARAGRQTVLVEAKNLAGRASGRNAGFLLTGSAEPLTKLVAAVGEDRARGLWEVSRESRELLRSEILDPGRVECGFLPEGSWVAGLVGSGQAEALAASTETLRSWGFEAEWRDARTARRACGSELVDGALFQPRDGGLDPVRLARGLAALGLFGVRTGVRVRGLESRGERIHLTTSAGDLLASRVVLAVNAYAPTLLPRLAAEIRPVRGQMLATVPGERVLTGVWALNSGLELVRQLADGTVLVGGRRQVAEAAEVGYLESPTATVQGALDDFLAETLPALQGRPVAVRWAGTMAFTGDGLPRLGEVEHLPGVFYAAGFNGRGLSLGFAVGRWLARRAAGEDAAPLFGVRSSKSGGPALPGP